MPAFASGDLLTRLIEDVDSLQDLLLRVVPPFAIAFGVGAATVAAVWLMLPTAALILLGALLVAATLVPWLTGFLAARSEARQAAARATLSSAVIDLLEGAPKLAVNGAMPAQLGRAMTADTELTSIARKSARTAGVGRGLTTLCCGLAMWGALLVGVAAVHAGRMSGVLLAGIALIPLVAFELVVALPGATQTLQRVRRSAARVLEVIDTPAPVAEPAEPRPLPPGPMAQRQRAHCQLPRLVAAGARRGAARPAPRPRVALVGPSGAGKTTLAAVALRFLPYTAGSIALNGVEIAELSGEDCRRVIGLVSQDAHVFDNTLEENLRLARRDATSEQLREALSRARLLDWAERLPAGMATAGERGARMSGGQRQRLAIARALLADFPVLILDEPESISTPPPPTRSSPSCGRAARASDAADHPSSRGPRGDRRGARAGGWPGARAGHARGAARARRSLRRAVAARALLDCRPRRDRTPTRVARRARPTPARRVQRMEL